jgi:hypothetical protein
MSDRCLLPERGRVIVCQGPPWCDLTGDAAERAIEQGCRLCKIITIFEDDSEDEFDPLARDRVQ